MTQNPSEGSVRALLALLFVTSLVALLGAALLWPVERDPPRFLSQRGIDGPVDESGQGPLDTPEELVRKVKQDEARQAELLARRVRELTRPKAP